MIHDFGDYERREPAGLAERFNVEWRIDASGRYVGNVPESGGRELAGVVAGNGEPEIDRRRHRDVGRAELRPVLSVEPGVTGEVISGAFQAKPGIRIINGK